MDEQFLNKFAQAYGKIKTANNILLITHFNADGDALASICAMIEFLEQREKKYFAYCHNQPGEIFDFLPHLEKINFTEAVNEPNGRQTGQSPNFSEFDLIVVLDCGSLSRTRLDKQILDRRPDQFIIEIDHHPKVDSYADLEIRNHHAAATAELLYYFFKHNQIRLNKNMAQCVLTGILTDTANFLYPSTSKETVDIASQMLTMGARLPKIMENTLRNKSLEGMKIWGKVMASLEINKKYNLAIAVLTLDDLNHEEMKKDELDGISNFLGNLYGVKATLFLREEGGGIVRGSIRTSDPDGDISKLAQILGGGGHTKSAGFSVAGKIEKMSKGWRVI